MRVSVKCNGYRSSVLAARDRNDALAAIFRANRHRLLNALARSSCFDSDWNRHGNCFGSSRLCRVYAAIAPIACVPPLVVLPPHLAVVHRVPPVVIVLPPKAFVVHRVVAMAAKFEASSALSATMPRHSCARMGEKQKCYGGHRKRDLSHKIIIQ